MKNYLLPVAGVAILISLVFINLSVGRNYINYFDFLKLETEINEKELSERDFSKKVGAAKAVTNDREVNLVSEISNEMVIGINNSTPVDNPDDNILAFNLKEKLPDNAIVVLEYDLFGLENYSSVCRSINDQLVTGGKIIKINDDWSEQKEYYSANCFDVGNNKIRFCKPNNYDISYKIKNIRISVENTATEKPAVKLMDTDLEIYNDKYSYVNGFVYGIDYEEIERVSCNGVEFIINEGVFEGVFTVNPLALETNILVELTDGSEIIKPIQFSRKLEADYINQDVFNYKRISSTVTPLENINIELNNFSINAPKGIVDHVFDITVTGLRNVDVPILSPSMVNVTSENAGYRCLPHGKHFKKPVSVTLGYDKQKLPDGYNPNDIRTFYYNDTLAKWIMLPYAGVDTTDNLVISKTDHFTDFINAIIKTPELPEAAAFTPTSMKDEDYGDPWSGFNFIQQPKANNKGSVETSFPLQIPKGRQGMEPNLAINYNSDKGNSWLGVGWDLSMPAITIDSKWGVPRFSEDYETESYLVNGEQIVELNGTSFADRYLPSFLDNEYRVRGTETETHFVHRIEGAFHKLIRHGNTTDTYWWEVIDKQGTRYLYGKYNDDTGVNDACVLRQPGTNNIAHWALAEVRDVFGNYVKYEYNTVEFTGTPGNGGKQIYINKITYTGFDNTDGKYSLDFNRTNRDDYFINARNGFLEVTDQLLESIVVRYNGTFVRKYLLDYGIGAYKKAVLQAIADITDPQYADMQIDYANIVQHFGATIHCFEYYEEEGVDFGPSKTILNSIEAEDILFGNQYEGDIIQSIGRNKNLNASIGGSACIGIGGNVSSKNLSFGINYTRTLGNSSQKAQLIDVNGDKLLDKVIKSVNGVNFHRGLLDETTDEFKFEDTPTQIPSLERLTQTKSKGNTFGAELLAGAGSIGGSVSYARSVTKSLTTRYFTDINADGLIDFFNEGEVLFNSLDEDDNPQFNLSSTEPEQYMDDDECYYINYNGEITSLPNVSGDEIKQRRDPVIMWKVPEDGRYHIGAGLSRITPNPNEDLNGFVSFGYQFKDANASNSETSCKTLGPADQTNNGSYGYVDAIRGDVIYFRLHADDDMGADDFDWDVFVRGPLDNNDEYPDLYDANDKHIYSFEYQNDVIVHDGGVFSAPFDGQIDVTTMLNFIEQSDDLNYQIIYREWDESNEEFLNDAILIDENYTNGSAVVNEENNISFTINKKDQIIFQLVSQSNVNWGDIDFDATIEYNSYIVDGTTYNDNQVFYPSLQMSYYSDIVRRSEPINLNVDGDYAVHPELTFLTGSTFTGTITLTAKSQRELLGSMEIDVVDGVIAPPP